MERYTYFEGGKWRIRAGDTEHSGPWVARLAAYEDTGLEPEDFKKAFNEESCSETVSTSPWNYARPPAGAGQGPGRGGVVVLPCEVGDTVWFTRAIFTNYPEPKAETVIGFAYPWHDPSGDLLLVCCKGGRKFTANQIGDTVFLTRAEAEAAQREEGQDA